MSQKKEQKTSLVLLPAVTAINLGAKALSAVTGTNPDQLKETAGSILRGGERSTEGLRSQLDTASRLIARLQQEIIERGGESLVLAGDIIEDDLKHAIRPSLDAEYDVERQLFKVLQQRIADTELAEQYKANAQSQAVHFDRIIEELQVNLRKELAVIEVQDRDRADLEKLAEQARNTIDDMKRQLDNKEIKRQELLSGQKLRYQEQQQRIVSEFEAATDFCRDLRRKLQVEIDNNKKLAEANSTQLQELEALQKNNEANIARLQELSLALQKVRHEVARLNQERQKESEESKQEITKLREKILVVQDRITIIEQKGAKERAKEMERVNKEKDVVIQDYEERLRHAKEENDADVSKHLHDYEVHVKQINELQEKDTADVEKEQKKAAGDIKKIENTHAHAVQKISTKIEKLLTEAASSARLATIIRDQLETEKTNNSGLEGRIAGIKGDLRIIEGQRNGLQERLTQFERDLNKEKDVSAKQLEAARKSMVSSYDNQRRVLTTTYENEVRKISEELKIQTQLAQEAGKRLTDTRRNLESKQFNLENELKELEQRRQAAEERTYNAEKNLIAAQQNHIKNSQEEAKFSSLLEEEKKRSSVTRSELKLQEDRTYMAANLNVDRVDELEREINSSKIFVNELRRQRDEEDVKGKKIVEDRSKTGDFMRQQIAELQREIESVRKQAEDDRQLNIRYEAEIQRAMRDNRNLKEDVDVAQQESKKAIKEKKEVHNVEVQVVERK